MRHVPIAFLMLVLCAPCAHADAKQKNAQGVALLKKKDYKIAAESFRQAIAEDPDHLLAHYNLACAASLMQDRDTALTELTWLGNRSAYDREAKKIAVKAEKDPDLKWIFDEQGTTYEVSRSVTPEYPRGDLLVEKRPFGIVGNPLIPTKKAAADRAMAQAPGKHDDKCDGAASDQGDIFEVGAYVVPELKGEQTLRASLRDGLAIFDEKEKLIARTEPFGCTAPRAPKDKINTFLIGGDVVAIEYANGAGKADWHSQAVLFRVRGTDLVKVFDVPTGTSRDPKRGKLYATPLGDLIYQAPGSPKETVFRWDEKAFKYVEFGPPR
jgi:hypothetical protein